MNEKKIYEIMLDEYRRACTDYYEARYGEKINTNYTIKNEHTGEVLTGSVSGCRNDAVSKESMRVIGKMILEIFGNQTERTLEEIRKEERRREKAFFENNPQFVIYVTDLK